MAEVKAQTVTLTKLSLALTEMEVEILKGWMQNRRDNDIQPEPEVERNLRVAIFEALRPTRSN